MNLHGFFSEFSRDSGRESDAIIRCFNLLFDDSEIEFSDLRSKNSFSIDDIVSQGYDEDGNSLLEYNILLRDMSVLHFIIPTRYGFSNEQMKVFLMALHDGKGVWRSMLLPIFLKSLELNKKTINGDSIPESDEVLIKNILFVFFEDREMAEKDAAEIIRRSYGH